MKTPRKTLLSSSSPSNPTSGSRPWIPIKEAFLHLLAFMAVVAIVVFFLRWHIKSSYEEEVLFWQVRLTGVADDQAQRVSDWLKERQGDAMVSSSRPSLRAVLRDYNEKGRLPKSLSARQSFPLSTLDEIATWYSYAGVYILDRDAHVVMQSSHSIPLNPFFAASCRTVARAGVARDELAGDTPSRTLMGFIAPVFPEHTSTGPGQSAGQPPGSVLLVSDASQALFPMVTREIIPSRTGESVLVRRDGDEVVYFSPLRHISVGSPNPRFPLSAAPVPAKYALENRQTYAEYNDYRGAPVLAATQGIPRTRWGLVRKIDRAEALKDFHHGALLECLAGAILILLLGSLLLILRRYIVARERERTGQELRRLNRALRTISGCNQVLVRAEKEPDLLSQVCETLVRLGGYRMAWVGFAEHDEAKSVRPVGQAGFEDGYLQAANITWADTERGQGPTGRAIRSGSVQVARDLLLDPSLAPWREEARKRGYASSITLPLFLDGEVLGALMVYAEAPDAFDSSEENLLTELADDLAYGIQALRTRVEHQRAEEALHNEKAFTESIIDSLPDSFFIIDATGRYVRWNKNAGKALGYSAEEFATLDPLALVVEDERPLAASKMQEALTRGSATADFHLLAKDGRKIPYLMTATRAVIDDKIYLIGIGVDITARKRAEESVALLKHSIDIHYDGAYWTDTGNRFIYINDAGCKSLGYEREELIGKTILEVNPKASPQDLDRVWETLRSQGFFSTESVHRRKDGSEFPVEIVTTYVQFGGREFSCGFARDITERKRAEEELYRSRQLLQSILDTIPQRVFWKDRNASYLGCNKALAIDAELKDPAEIVGKNDYELSWRETAGFYRADDELVMKQDTARLNYEETQNRPDGSVIWLRTSKLPLHDQEGKVIGVIGTYEDITERKRTEEALIQERHLLHSLMDNLPDRIYFKDRESRFTRINKAHAEQFGLSDPGQAVGKTDFDFLPAERAQRASHDEQEIIRTGRPIVDREGKLGWPDGHVSWFATTKMPLRDPNGNIIGTFGISHDITERKRAEEALRESEGKYRSLVSNIPDVVWTLDANLRFVFISRNIERMSGFSADEVDHLGADLYLASLHPDDVLKVKDGLRALFADGRPYDVECRIRRKNGEWIWIHDRAVSTYEKSGMRYADGLLSDITEHKRAEAEHVRLVTAIEQSAEAVVITNPAGNIEYVNPAFTRITGYSRGEVLGRNPRILKSEKHDPDFYQQLWETILKGQTWQGELTNRRKDGSLYTEQMTITPVRDEHGEVTHFIATKQDVTERLALEAHLHQTSKMQAVGKLAGGVAHDFNNLLTVINGYSQILIEEIVTDAKAIDYLRQISNAGERAASLTRQLLAFSRHQVLSPQVLGLNAVVSNLEKMLRRLIGEDIELHTLLNPSLARVKADPGQIEQVIMNLAVNARDAMPKGGNLAIETGNVELDEDYARKHPTVKPGPHVALVVSDTGVGMTPETQARIFEPFFTTKEMGQGTGLGLATVYGIVKQSGGSVWVYSEVGKGTTFKIYFPVATDVSAVKEPPRLKMDSASGTETVLVVEDDEAVRSLVRLALISGGYKVLETPNPESALAICSSHDGPIHLLLTDVVMPQMSGPEVASKVAALRPGIRVLYMSGYTDDAVVHHGVLSQEMPFIQKPFSPVSLRKKIREVLG